MTGSDESFGGTAYVRADIARDLLASLKDIIRIAKAASHGHTFNAQRIERAEAAIAKAEGRE
jgi:hypothetical protein